MSRCSNSLRWVNMLFFAAVYLALSFVDARAIGSWVALSNTGPGKIGIKLLLSNGTVMAQICTNSVTCGTTWCRLTPDETGSYANGTWKRADGNWDYLSPMTYERTDYSSDVLPDGRVFIIGGEYASTAGGAPGELYNPVSDTWSLAAVPPGAVTEFGDGMSVVLPGGRVLIAPKESGTMGGTVVYDPGSGVWLPAGNPLRSQAEVCWVTLADGSVLSVDFDWDGVNASTSERYIPAQNRWVDDSVLPVTLFHNQEIGAGFLLPDDKVLFLGGSGHTAIYSPSGTVSPGSWIAGPDIPNGRQAGDTGGAMMANGKIILVVGAHTQNGGTPAPCWFYEYDPSVNSFEEIGAPDNAIAGAQYAANANDLTFLTLPDGTVLVSDGADPTGQAYVYRPQGSQVVAGKPAISSITVGVGGSYVLSGTGLNGISSGAAFGDDAQMASNYPIVRVSSLNGAVVRYGRTWNWTSTGVMTGAQQIATTFDPPLNLVAGNEYSLSVIANGVASDPVPLSAPVWVDFSYTGTVQNGGFDFPYPTLAQGIAATPAGGSIRIKGPGQSEETFSDLGRGKPCTVVARGGAVIIGR